jgi:hypothetical protein
VKEMAKIHSFKRHYIQHQTQYGHHIAHGNGKVEKVMHEFKHHQLHSGSKHGPLVTNHRQAVAIALSEARKRGAHV